MDGLLVIPYQLEVYCFIHACTSKLAKHFDQSSHTESTLLVAKC